MGFNYAMNELAGEIRSVRSVFLRINYKRNASRQSNSTIPRYQPIPVFSMSQYDVIEPFPLNAILADTIASLHRLFRHSCNYFGNEKYDVNFRFRFSREFRLRLSSLQNDKTLLITLCRDCAEFCWMQSNLTTPQFILTLCKNWNEISPDIDVRIKFIFDLWKGLKLNKYLG